MAEETPKFGPNLADAPASQPENAQVFGYNVAQQSRVAPQQKPNTASPLAAG